MSSSPFDPWWYYEMGKMSMERSRQPQQGVGKKPTPKRPTVGPGVGLGIGLIGVVVFWAVATISLSIGLYALATIFGGLDFWLCVVISGIFSFWICSLCLR